jgi:hypothetical protein
VPMDADRILADMVEAPDQLIDMLRQARAA